MKLSFLLRAGTHACALAHSPLFVSVPDCFRFIHLEGLVKYLGTRLLLTSLLAVARYEARFPEGPTTLPKDYVRLCFTPFGFGSHEPLAHGLPNSTHGSLTLSIS